MGKIVCVMGVGELKTDVIYKKVQDSFTLLKMDGGGAAWNVLCNLGARNIPTMALGICGKDRDGEICVDSLKKFGVNVENIVRIGDKTTRISITIPDGSLEDESITSSWTCPITGEKHNVDYGHNWHNLINIPSNVTGIVVIDDLKNQCKELALKLKNERGCKIALDIGKRGFVRKISNDELVKHLKLVDFLQVNQKVGELLFERLNMNETELLKSMGLETLILTKGSKGVEFIWREGQEVKRRLFEIAEPAKIIDSNGAGDAFLSNFLGNYIKQIWGQGTQNEKFFEDTFNNGIKLSSKVVGCIGARGHLHEKGD